MKKKFAVPEPVSRITKTLENAHFEAYLVGGCVRDLLRGCTPKDWDITTNAKPDEILGLFENTYYNNDFGTVGIVNDDEEGKPHHVVEVTPYRLETTYSDGRHPDEVVFSDKLEEDLARRDFTINAIAYSVSKGQIIDPYKGQEDIARKIIRAVGNPLERLREDGLRILRAIRLSSELEFAIDTDTEKAIADSSEMLKKISKERIRDELIRILMSTQPMQAIARAQILGVLNYVSSNFARGVGVKQNQAHSFDVFEHLLRATQHAADKKWSFEIRLAALFHDISKPETRRWSDEKKDWTFHGHEVVGARVTKRALEELKFPKKTIEKVVKLVRWHMFFSDPDKITLSAVRRMIRNVGGETNMWDLLNLRICDRVGTGRPKEQPFRFRKYKSMVEEVLRDPISVAMLNITGSKIMELTSETPGPKIGYTLNALLEEVLDDPKKNTKDILEKRAKELLILPIEELRKLGEKGKERGVAADEENVEKIREKHWVK